MPRSAFVPAAAVVIALLAGFSSARFGDARFTVTSVSLAGPASIPNGESRSYAVTLTIRRAHAASRDTLVGTQSFATPVRPGLFAGGTRLSAAESDLARTENARTLRISLRCVDGEVRGDENGSGAGARAGSAGVLGLPWWDRPARVRARLSDRESNELAILCSDSR